MSGIWGSQATSNFVTKDEHDTTNGYLYILGDADTDGSIRFSVVSNNTQIEKRVSGVWTLAVLNTGVA